MRVMRFEQTKILFGGEAKISLVSDVSVAQIETYFKLLWQKLARFERQFSRFLPQSELTLVNQQAGKWTPISPEMSELISVVRQVSEKTGGLFNPFVLPALQRAGYMNSAVKEYEHEPVPSYIARSIVPYTSLDVRDGAIRIPKHSAIDLGGIGKGFIADKIRAELEQLPLKGYVIWLSGDIATWGRDENGSAWRVGIQDVQATDGEIPYSIICPESQFAIATSGTRKRAGQKPGNWHHIIDPQTGKSAETDVAMLTVCDSSLTWADVLASCGILKGSKHYRQFLKSHEIENFIVQTSKKIITNGPCVMHDLVEATT